MNAERDAFERWYATSEARWWNTSDAAFAAWCAARAGCANVARDLRDAWMQEHGADSPYDAGRCTALANVEDAIRGLT